MELSTFIAFVVVAIVFTGFGMWLYRYQLKKNPEKLEELAQRIKNLGNDSDIS